jgi:ribosome-binding factor A
LAKQAIITGVNCYRDLRHAKVNFASLDPVSRESVHKALQALAGLLRSFLAQSLPLRLIPELSFFLDTSEEYGRRIDSLLRTVVPDSILGGESDEDTITDDEYDDDDDDDDDRE